MDGLAVSRMTNYTEPCHPVTTWNGMETWQDGFEINLVDLLDKVASQDIPIRKCE